MPSNLRSAAVRLNLRRFAKRLAGSLLRETKSIEPYEASFSTLGKTSVLIDLLLRLVIITKLSTKGDVAKCVRVGPVSATFNTSPESSGEPIRLTQITL